MARAQKAPAPVGVRDVSKISSSDRVRATPIIKYPGGKRWATKVIGPAIEKYLDETGGRFIDPFFGGGAIPLWLARPNMVLSDLCIPVMEMYETIRDKPGEVAYGLSALGIMGVDESNYYRVRDMRPTQAVQRAARMVYMNKLGFNGVMRFNSEGQYNVPVGDAIAIIKEKARKEADKFPHADDTYRKSIIERSERDAITSLFPNKEKFIHAAKALAGSEIYWCDFAEVAQMAATGDVIIFDPPYHDGFNGYTGKGFDTGAQERLAAEALAAGHAGAVVIAFNSDTPLIRKLYPEDEWAIIPSKEKRSVNRDGGGRGRVQCLIITNQPDMIDISTMGPNRDDEEEEPEPPAPGQVDNSHSPVNDAGANPGARELPGAGGIWWVLWKGQRHWHAVTKNETDCAFCGTLSKIGLLEGPIPVPPPDEPACEACIRFVTKEMKKP